jgi:TRAP-type uncharacterized transport system fused permease subunit
MPQPEVNDDHVLTEQETEELIAQFDRESNARHFTGIPNIIIKGLLVLFAIYIFWITLIGNLPEQVRRCVFVGVLVFLGYLLYPLRKNMTKRKNYIP